MSDQPAPVPGGAEVALTEDERRDLADAIHIRNEFDHDVCDHGTYSGGPSNGKPYAMCERMAGAGSIVTAAVEGILAARLAASAARAEALSDLLDGAERDRDIYANKWAAARAEDPRLEKVRADAWAEGYGAGIADEATSRDLTDGQVQPARVNPYSPPTPVAALAPVQAQTEEGDHD